MFVTRGNESKTCRVGRINQLWCGLWSIDHDSKPRKGILLFHAQSSCTGDELAGQRLRTISADHKIGAEYSRSAIRGLVVHIRCICFVIIDSSYYCIEPSFSFIVKALSYTINDHFML